VVRGRPPILQAHLKFERKVDGPHLVVVPLSVLPNWMAEFRRFAPDMRVVRIHVNDEGERQRLRTEVLARPDTFDVAVTTYDMVNSVHFGDTLKRTIHWRYGSSSHDLVPSCLVAP
jgi:SWI/SNF-related matrix-associated actin-dependent regulator of chromatin subfamily A member 5